MKNQRKLFSMLLVMCLMLSISTTVFAADYNADTVKPGISGIQPNDTMEFPNNIECATFTALWGVRVAFLDWDERELKTEVVPIAGDVPGSTSAPAEPARDGYTFTAWKRIDKSNATAVLNDNGNVTGINGPGPIIYIADYTEDVNEGPGGSPKTGKTVAVNKPGNILNKQENAGISAPKSTAKPLSQMAAKSEQKTVPLRQSPRTGDHSNAAGWMLLAFFSLLIMSATVYCFARKAR